MIEVKMHVGTKLLDPRPAVEWVPVPPPSRWERAKWAVADYWPVFVWGCLVSAWLQLLVR
jgi:hypothetical protein